MKLKKSILFWTAVTTAVYLVADCVFRICGLRFRIWVREPVTLLIAAAAAIGLLQLLLHIPKKWIKVITILLWIAAVFSGGFFGLLIFAFSHLEERTETDDGTEYVVEIDRMLWTSREYYYEKHGPFLRGTEVLYTIDE